LTAGGICLFVYFVYAVGFDEIYNGVLRFGLMGFAVILAIFLARIYFRAYAWKLAVHGPYDLSLRDAIPAVVIGEAMSSTIPLGILISGTAKAVAVRKRLPLVVGLSSVATENLFYCLVTGIFLILGAIALLRGYAVDESLIVTLDVLIASVAMLLVLGLVMVIRQWHFASATCEWLYSKGFLRNLLETGRHDVRRFEDLIYGFYRRHSGRFLPICLFETLYFVGGVAESWYILSRLVDIWPSPMTALILESVSRFITLIFKLIPFVIGVDEAGSQFVSDTLAFAAGIGVTLAIIRKGRILFWTAIGLVLIIKRGISITELSNAEAVSEASETV
jgi:Lysylphosphatidylglycerol synthase TM region